MGSKSGSVASVLSRFIFSCRVRCLEPLSIALWNPSSPGRNPPQPGLQPDFCKVPEKTAGRAGHKRLLRFMAVRLR